jgi:hypothetical protein
MHNGNHSGSSNPTARHPGQDAGRDDARHSRRKTDPDRRVKKQQH